MNTDNQTLNCIIPDEWMQECIANRLLGREKAVFEKLFMKITNCRRKDGAFFGTFLQREAHSLLRNFQLVWIRTPRTAELVQVARACGVKYMLAEAKTTRTNFRGHRRIIWQRSCGIVVDIRDACRVITTFYPDRVEDRRAEVYNNDEH